MPIHCAAHIKCKVRHATGTSHTVRQHLYIFYIYIDQYCAEARSNFVCHLSVQLLHYDCAKNFMSSPG